MNDKKFREDLKEYFDSQETVELSAQQREHLRALTRQNKSQRKITVWKRIFLTACSFCLLLLIVLPTVAYVYKANNPDTPPTNPPTIYYGDDEATKKDLTDQPDLVRSIISNGYSQYEFIFDEFDFSEVIGFYTPDEAELLALQITASEKVAPFTLVKINLIMSEQFVFSSKADYMNDATHTTNDTYELYKKSYSDIMSEYLYAYLKSSDYELYLNFDKVNEMLFNKFI
ncbi:MAG: hypothetical protein E7351_03605 [Clostridiales bacterium]|nr:hypothetical protein [Clostridiales bacterium]